MRCLKIMDFSKYCDWSLEQLFKKYIDLQPDSEEEYYPDFFLKDIHTEYLKNEKVRLPHPLYATWDIIKECNLNCVFCSAAAPKIKNDYIENGNVNIVVDKLMSSGIKYISIRGGEPTLYRDITKVIEKLIHGGIFVEIVTNGCHVNAEFVDTIATLPKSMYRIKISIDSYRESVNDNQRGRGSFDIATNAMELCHENGIEYRNQMVITTNNYQDIKNTYELCASLGAVSFGCMLLLPIGRGKNSKLRISLNKEILLQLISIIENPKDTKVEKIGLGVDAIKLYTPYLNDESITSQESVNIGHIKCNGAKTRIYINSNGDIYPCDLLQYDEFLLGNIMNNDDFWYSQNARRFCNINRLNTEICKDCQVKGCNMGCLAISIENSRKSNRKIPNCEV